MSNLVPFNKEDERIKQGYNVFDNSCHYSNIPEANRHRVFVANEIKESLSSTSREMDDTLQKSSYGLFCIFY